MEILVGVLTLSSGDGRMAHDKKNIMDRLTIFQCSLTKSAPALPEIEFDIQILLDHRFESLYPAV